jgi:hypothetical protein
MVKQSLPDLEFTNVVLNGKLLEDMNCILRLGAHSRACKVENLKQCEVVLMLYLNAFNVRKTISEERKNTIMNVIGGYLSYTQDLIKLFKADL